jgi:DinB family protein
MPFAYYARLNRAQQAIYRKSDAVTEIRLPRPADLHPLVGDLESALLSEERRATQLATERLIRGLTDALAVSPVRVEVLAARPHARWGELHGLYTAERGQTPKIHLWMRTAKQRRVVAFRTYLRTLLHEVGHHIDYTRLELADSFHTEGFYKRESSLFHQIYPDAAPRPPAGMFGDYAGRPLAERMARLERTPQEVAEVLQGSSEQELSRRPAPAAWSAREVVCHLRDLEELHAERIERMLATDEPVLIEVDTERWIEERQYQRQHVGEAWDAFARTRDQTLARLRALDRSAWRRTGVHPSRGRLAIDDLVSMIAWHDDHHLAELRRALPRRAARRDRRAGDDGAEEPRTGG